MRLAPGPRIAIVAWICWIWLSGGLALAPRAASAKSSVPSEKDVARLRRGAERFDAADYPGAYHELLPLAQAPLQNHDLALYLLAQCEALLTPPRTDEALAHFGELAGHRDSAYGPLALGRKADLLFDKRRDADARAAYHEVLASNTPALEPAVARFRLAEIAERGGDRAGALAGFRAVYVQHPMHPLSDRAVDRLRALDPAFAPTPAEHIERAKRMREERGWQRALDELSLLPGGEALPAALRDEADYQEGITHFKMRHGYDIAAKKLLDVWPRLAESRRADALFHGARAYSRSDDDDRAIAGYRLLLEKFPHAKPAPEASFLIGWLEFNRGRWKEALPGLEACIQRYGDSSFVDDAHWYLGLSKWMMGDAAGALVEFEWMSRRSGALDGGKGRYWKGRALDRLGRVPEAIVEWRKLAADYPFTYYALQARVRLGEHGVALDVFGHDTRAGADPTPSPSETSPSGDAGLATQALDPAVQKAPELLRTDELLAAGLPVEAARALDRVDGELMKRFGAARALPVLYDRYLRASDYFHVHRLAESHAGSALRRDPHKDPAARVLWQRVYPLAYRPFVEKYAPTGKNPPYYLYTIMLKESAYNPHDVSYADAIGLLQMIPPTSRRVGERIGRPYTDDVLYDPEGNVQFGAWYIGHLLEKFKGQIALGAGSYNAGPKAMMRWVQKSGARPLDEFIEQNSYTQTREYMKKALDIYARYEWLYARRDYLPDEKIDAAYLQNEIDY